MSRRSGNNINFYAAYEESTRTKRESGKGLLALVPLFLLLLALCTVIVLIRMQNLQKSTELDSLNRQIAQLDTSYNEVLALADESASLSDLADSLEADAAFEAAYPTLDENLFTQVAACAGTTFNISVYRYNEDTATLEIDASAPSVNDMPELVEALRLTGLFSTVQYVGYTSDTDGVYYCTVGCVLAD